MSASQLCRAKFKPYLNYIFDGHIVFQSISNHYERPCISTTLHSLLIFFQFSNQHDEKKETPRVQAIVGICAMEKKSLSKPMKEILSRMGEFEYIKTIIFPEDTIVNVS